MCQTQYSSSQRIALGSTSRWVLCNLDLDLGKDAFVYILSYGPKIIVLL